MWTSFLLNNTPYKVFQMRPNTWILKSGEKGEINKLYSLLSYSGQSEIADLILGREDLTLVLHQGVSHPKALQNWLKSLMQKSTHKTIPIPLDHHLEVDFSKGLDWDAVLKYSGLAKKEYIENLCARPLEVAMLGFLPGFIYLQGLDPGLHVPRKAKPVVSVSAQSFAIGGDMAGIYHFSSPGGWHVIGQTIQPLFDLDQPLKPGDRIHVKAI